jgi:hypothetical protein
MSKAKAPVLSSFGGAINGLSTLCFNLTRPPIDVYSIASIRAYDAQEMFRKRSLVRIDHYVSTSRCFYNVNRWVTVRIDILGNLFSCIVAAYLVYVSRGTNPYVSSHMLPTNGH